MTAAVEVRGVSKNYPLENSQLARFRHVFAANKQNPKNGIWALRDVTFSVARGEAFGIIGANGSGKSTLLQIVAGILRPTAGSVEVHGRLSALLELGSGFSPEFSGRDNVYLNASLLGLSRDEIDARFTEIERFAGIGLFIDQPIKTYSTGMVLRLAFAVSAHADPEVLIVDEALAVGDIAFRQRCMRRIHELRARGTTILFVSHEAGDVKALCERCLWLQNGVVQDLGAADEVVARYLSAAMHKAVLYEGTKHIAPVEVAAAAESAPDLVLGFRGPVEGHRYGDGRATIVGADLVDASGRPIDGLAARQHAVIRVSFRIDVAIEAPIAGFLVRNGRGENIFGTNTARENYPLPPMQPGESNNVDFHWSTPDLAAGSYRISVAISDGNVEDFHVCDYIEDAIEVKADGSAGGYFHLRCSAVTIRSGEERAMDVVNKGSSVV